MVNKTGSATEAQLELQRYAIDAWTNFYHNANKTKKFVDGSLSCFCNEQYEKYGINTAQRLYSKQVYGGTFVPSLLKTQNNNQICREFILFNRFNRQYRMVLAFSIIFINLLFYQIIIPLVKKIGFARKTREEELNYLYMVACMMLDMVVLPILIGSNLKEWNIN